MPFPRDPAAYPAEFFAIFKHAAEKPLEIELPTSGLAVNLRQRLYGFRRSLQQTHHPLASVAYACEIIIDPERKNFIIARPAGWSLRGALEKAGLTLEHDESIVPPEPTPDVAPPEDNLSDTLAGFGFQHKEDKE